MERLPGHTGFVVFYLLPGRF